MLEADKIRADKKRETANTHHINARKRDSASPTAFEKEVFTPDSAYQSNSNKENPACHFNVPKNVTLQRNEKGLALVKDGMELRADFLSLLPRTDHNKIHRELLVRAAKIKGEQNPIAIDATAGFGEDSFLLAATGFTVYLFERDPIIAALLQDALDRATQTPELATIANHMTLIEANSITELAALSSGGSSVLTETMRNDFPDKETLRPDVIYLDPMFPERTKSAAVKKKFQLIHILENPCENEEEILSAALNVRPRKVVIKRPVKGPFLANAKPSYSLKGKAVRYDCFVFA